MSRRMRVGRSLHACAYEPVFSSAYARLRKFTTGYLHGLEQPGVDGSAMRLNSLPRKMKKRIKSGVREDLGWKMVDYFPILPGDDGGLYAPGFRDPYESINIWVRMNGGL